MMMLFRPKPCVWKAQGYCWVVSLNRSHGLTIGNGKDTWEEAMEVALSPKSWWNNPRILQEEEDRRKQQLAQRDAIGNK